MKDKRRKQLFANYMQGWEQINIFNFYEWSLNPLLTLSMTSVFTGGSNRKPELENEVIRNIHWTTQECKCAFKHTHAHALMESKDYGISFSSRKASKPRHISWCGMVLRENSTVLLTITWPDLAGIAGTWRFIK